MKMDESYGFLVNHAGRRMSQAISLGFAPYDITVEQWVVLHRLSEQDGVSHKALGVKAEKDPTNITRIVDQLTRKGLVERRSHPDDRRCSLLFITEAGRELDAVLTPIEQKVIADILEGLEPTDVVALGKALQHIATRACACTQKMEEALD